MTRTTTPLRAPSAHPTITLAKLQSKTESANCVVIARANAARAVQTVKKLSATAIAC